MRVTFSLVTALLLLASANAQIEVSSIFPPVIGPGQSTIAAEGKLPNWPCQIDCDRDDLKFTPAEKSGQFNVIVPADSSPGVTWIRLYDQKSASKLMPLLIEPVAVTGEPKESTGEISKALKIELPAVIAGRLAKNNEIDGVRISLTSGDTLVASMIAHQVLNSPMDAVLQIVDPSGNVLAQSDDVRGLDPQLIYRSGEDADVVVRIFAFPSTPNSSISFSGGSNYLYALRLTTGPFLDHVSPIAAGSVVRSAAPAGWNLPSSPAVVRHEPTGISPATWHLASGAGWHWQPCLDRAAANLVEAEDQQSFTQADQLPAVFCGRISQSKQIDRLRFHVTKGKKYAARSYSRSSGFLLDTVLRIIDVKSGEEIARKDDSSRTDFDAAVEFRATADSEYELQISDAVEGSGTRHVYAVLLEETLPSVKLTVAAEQFVLAAGGSLEIPVTVTRSNGYAQKISVAARGLPQGVAAMAVLSEPKGDTAKSVKLKLSAKSDVTFQGNIQIMGTEIDAENKPAGETHVASFALRPGIELRQLWLTVTPKD